MIRWTLMLVAVALIGCEVRPEEVAQRYVKAREHGHGAEAYGLLSEGDRTGRPYEEFLRRDVQAIDERVVRLLARRTKVRAGPATVDAAEARVRIDIARVSIDPVTLRRLAGELKSGGPELASRLQKLDLPIRTSTETVDLVREKSGWRVRLRRN